MNDDVLAKLMIRRLESRQIMKLKSTRPGYRIRLSICAMLFSITCFLPARAAETVVPLSGKFALLNMPSGMPRDGVILFTGNVGYVGVQPDGSVRNKRGGSMMISTRGWYSRSGVASLLIDQGANASEAVELLKKRGVRNVYLVGESRGCLRAMDGLDSGITGIVLISCMHDEVKVRFGKQDRIPPKTLVIHHIQDRCYGALPYKAEDFIRWAGARVQVSWLAGGSDDGGHPCRSQTFHGMKDNEGNVVSKIIQFVKR
jgi:hypothetical protein